MIDHVFIVVKYVTRYQPTFMKVFFKREAAELFVRDCVDPQEMYQILTFVKGQMDDGTAEEI